MLMLLHCICSCYCKHNACAYCTAQQPRCFAACPRELFKGAAAASPACLAMRDPRGLERACFSWLPAAGSDTRLPSHKRETRTSITAKDRI
jgi:hypothetical protein